MIKLFVGDRLMKLCLSQHDRRPNAGNPTGVIGRGQIDQFLINLTAATKKQSLSAPNHDLVTRLSTVIVDSVVIIHQIVGK